MGNEKPTEKTTFNYLFSHRVLPQCIFQNPDLFFTQIITNPTNLQIFLQNVLLTATAWAQKYQDTIEGGYEIPRFQMYLENGMENGVIVVRIPNCIKPCDCNEVAIPCASGHERYFTCELSENPLDGTKCFIVGEWKKEEGSVNLNHFNYGELDAENGETFASKVIKLVYDIDYMPPAVEDRIADLEHGKYEILSNLAGAGWFLLLPTDYDEKTHSFTPNAVSAFERAKLLIEHGADVNAVNEWNQNPLALVIAYCAGKLRKEFIDYLLNKGAKIDIAVNCMEKLSQGENSPEFHYALYELYSGLIEMPFADKWLNPDEAQRRLELAAKGGYPPAQDLLGDSYMEVDL